MAKILVIGAAGQLGIELVLALQAQHGVGNVEVSDIRVPDDEGVMRSRFLHLDVTDEGPFTRCWRKAGTTRCITWPPC